MSLIGKIVNAVADKVAKAIDNNKKADSTSGASSGSETSKVSGSKIKEKAGKVADKLDSVFDPVEKVVKKTASSAMERAENMNDEDKTTLQVLQDAQVEAEVDTAAKEAAEENKEDVTEQKIKEDDAKAYFKQFFGQDISQIKNAVSSSNIDLPDGFDFDNLGNYNAEELKDYAKQINQSLVESSDALKTVAETGELDFMEGLNPENEEEYNAQVNKLAQDEINNKDTDGDGAVSYEEYINSELADLPENASEDDVLYTKAAAEHIAHTVDTNGDGKLDTDELNTFYKNMDRFNGETIGEKGDGKISDNDAAGYVGWLLNNFYSDDILNQADTTSENAATAGLSDGFITGADLDNYIDTLNTPEEKAKAAAMFRLIYSAFGNNEVIGTENGDKKAISENAIQSFLRAAAKRGMTPEQYYEVLAEKNLAEGGAAYDLYQQYLEAYSN